MGRRDKEDGLSRGAWTAGEDKTLTDYINAHGEGKWRSLPTRAGLKRCGKSCRLRWLNYLRPDIKRGNISQDEQDLILRLHKLLGNRWSLIAGRLPGRTDNEIKNYCNTILCKKLHPPAAPRLLRRHNTQKPSSPPPSAAIQLPPPPHAIKTKPTRLSSNSKLPFVTSATTHVTDASNPTATTSTLPIFDQTSKQPCSLMIMSSSSSSSSSSDNNNNNIHNFVEFGFPTADFHQNIITTTTNNNDDHGGLLFPESFNWMGGSGGGINIFDGGNVYYDDDDGVFNHFPEAGVVMEDWVLD